MKGQPTSEVIEHIRDIPIYQESLAKGHFPLLDKPEIARGFPDNWMTPRLAAALQTGEAEFVLSTGTNHARMQIIRPPYFLLRSYYELWRNHPDIGETWESGCRRVSLTTVLATEHVARVNAARRGVEHRGIPILADRWLDERTCYLNLRLDPAQWVRKDVLRMLREIDLARSTHPQGRYHLDCSGYHLAHLVRKAEAWGLLDAFPAPASIITAYEYTPVNVRRFLRLRFACPVIDLFGSTELGYLYYSDREGRYRPHLAGMSVELLPVSPGSTIHQLIVTSVRNPDTAARPLPVGRLCAHPGRLAEPRGDHPILRPPEGIAEYTERPGRPGRPRPAYRGRFPPDLPAPAPSPRRRRRHLAVHDVHRRTSRGRGGRRVAAGRRRTDRTTLPNRAPHPYPHRPLRQVRLAHHRQRLTHRRLPLSERSAMTSGQTRSADDLKRLLGDALHTEVMRYFCDKAPDTPQEFVERQVTECLRYLYLVSRYRDRLSGLFLPVEQDIDEIWHYLILQTREYRALCEERLPGRFFINHRSIAYEDYQEEPGREQALEEALRWIPLYCREFGPFDAGALPHWTMVRFLHEQMGISLTDIADLKPMAVA